MTEKAKKALEALTVFFETNVCFCTDGNKCKSCAALETYLPVLRAELETARQSGIEEAKNMLIEHAECGDHWWLPNWIEDTFEEKLSPDKEGPAK